MRFMPPETTLTLTVTGVMLLGAGPPPVAADPTLHDISFQTDDEFTIRATLGLPDPLEGPSPGVILIHQGGSDRKEWASFAIKLLEDDLVTLAYDVRGHGKSQSVPDLHALFNDPDQAPLDLRAAIAYLDGLEEVDGDRVAVVGSSIGSNLACVAVALMGVKTAVAISGKTSAVFNLAGTDSLALRSVFYISSAGDQGGRRAVWASEMYDLTAEPRRIEIVSESAAHGVRMFPHTPGLTDRIREWLSETL